MWDSWVTTAAHWSNTEVAVVSPRFVPSRHWADGKRGAPQLLLRSNFGVCDQSGRSWRRTPPSSDWVSTVNPLVSLFPKGDSQFAHSIGLLTFVMLDASFDKWPGVQQSRTGSVVGFETRCPA